MRPQRAAASALAAAAIFLGGCGPGPNIDDPVPPSPHFLPFAQRAAAVLTNWRDSGAAGLWDRGLDRRWFTGLVLLDWTLTREWGHSLAVSEPCDATCWDIVRYRLAAPVPSRHPSSSGAVTFPGHPTPLRLPLIPAAAALSALPRDEPACADPGTACLTVTVTSVKLTTVTVPTSRGDARVPAWEFDFNRGGLPDEFDQVAVAPSAVTTLPEALLSPPLDLQRYGRVVSVKPDQADPRRLTVWVELPSGTASPRIAVLQTPAAIVLGAIITRSGSARRYRATITLAAPVDHRVILDAATGKPVG